jgi:hypothetical protein
MLGHPTTAGHLLSCTLQHWTAIAPCDDSESSTPRVSSPPPRLVVFSVFGRRRNRVDRHAAAEAQLARAVILRCSFAKRRQNYTGIRKGACYPSPARSALFKTGATQERKGKVVHVTRERYIGADESEVSCTPRPQCSKFKSFWTYQRVIN